MRATEAERSAQGERGVPRSQTPGGGLPALVAAALLALTTAPALAAPVARQLLAPPACPTQGALMAELRSLNEAVEELPEDVIITEDAQGYSLRLGSLRRGPVPHCESLIRLAAVLLSYSDTRDAAELDRPAPSRPVRPAGEAPPAMLKLALGDAPGGDRPGSGAPPVPLPFPKTALELYAGPTVEQSAYRPAERGVRADMAWRIGPLSAHLGGTLWQPTESTLGSFAAVSEARLSTTAGGCFTAPPWSDDWRVDGCLRGRYDHVALSSREVPESLRDASYGWFSAQLAAPLTYHLTRRLGARIEPAVALAPKPPVITSDTLGLLGQRDTWSYSLTVQLGYVVFGGS